MIRGQPYSLCRLFYDGLQPIDVGHFLKTPAGSAYRICEIRQHRTRPYRRNLQCQRWPVAEIPDGATVHPLYWYKRTRKPGRRLRDL